MISSTRGGLWSIEARGVLAALGLLASLGLLAAGWSSRTGPKTPNEPPPQLILDPNTAPPEILTALPGLGPGLVKNWVAAREERPFDSLDDLEQRVRGIGPAVLARIARYLEIPAASRADPTDKPTEAEPSLARPRRRRATKKSK